MKKNRISKVVILLMSFVLSAALAASEISDFFKNLNTFKATFYQIVEQDGKVVQRSSGNVQLKKPLKFRWDYQKPEKMQLLSDGKNFYHYDVDLEQATVKPATDAAGSAMMALLGDKEELDSAFKIKSFLFPSIKKRYPSQVTDWQKIASAFYELKPKKTSADDGQPNVILVGLTPSWQLSLLYVEDAYGKNTFIFVDIAQNQEISDKQFLFSAPKTVDIFGK